MQRCSIFGVRVGLNGSYRVQHLLKFIWGETHKDSECVSRSFNPKAGEDKLTTTAFVLTRK